jgi:murein DD-endopeptidase MepM/ murein hydrolase activator NlpD
MIRIDRLMVPMMLVCCFAIIGGIFALPLASSQAQSPTATPPPLIAPVQPTWTPTPIPTNTPRPVLAFTGEDHFYFARPFGYDPTGRIVDYPARGYAYGSKGGGGLSTHHGVDIENPTGTWIRTIGNGTVFYAGEDTSILFGPRLNFYGILVVIEHDQPAPDGSTLYSLYGHLSRTEVQAGDWVMQNDVIGEVGGTGVAFGPHLHLEIRIDDPYDYYSTLNPELWVEPWRDYGVFAARVIDENGDEVQGMRVELIGQRRFFTGWTYAEDSVNGDPYLQENIVIGDMPSGFYDLKVGEIRNVRHRDTVFIDPDTVTFITIQLSGTP